MAGLGRKKWAAAIEQQRGNANESPEGDRKPGVCSCGESKMFKRFYRPGHVLHRQCTSCGEIINMHNMEVVENEKNDD